MYWIVVILYILLLTFILMYSFSQANIALVYLHHAMKKKKNTSDLKCTPFVTVQLPVYNEKYVVKRLIEAIVSLDYPKEKIEIQVLDDSTDETVSIISELVRQYQDSGYNLVHVQRPERSEFKAGALKYGLESAKGEFIAIFDADFLPERDFLQQTLPYFEDEKVGVVQARWGHINQGYSLLTKLQSFALNAHFILEQTARNIGSHFINFNGTAGIWRKETIIDAGGWEGDTLTEDLDLSYRAQLLGWKFKYLEDVITPAELPVEMNAVKSQQFRWSKGAAECMRKNFFNVMKAKNLRFSTKIHAFFHLMNSFIWVCILFSALLLLPMQYFVKANDGFFFLDQLLSIFQVSFVLLLFFYLTANIVAEKKCPWQNCLKLVLAYPVFLVFTMGISIYNAIGVIEGYVGKKSPFVRTPKFNIMNGKDSINNKSYVKWNINSISILEVICFFYFLISAYFTFGFGNYQGFVLLLMMSGGIATVLTLSAVHHYRANRISA